MSVIQVPFVKVRIKRLASGRLLAMVKGVGDAAIHDGPDLLRKPFVKDLDRAKTLVLERLKIPADKVRFEVEE